MASEFRKDLSSKKRVVIKIGSSSLTHKDTNHMNLRKIESLARVLTDLRSRGMEVVLVSSGAIAAGRQSMNIDRRPDSVSEKQALSAIGQAQLIMAYQRVFSMYNQQIAQLLLTKYTFLREEGRVNAMNTFTELFQMGVVPIVNENDTIATHEIEMGDNDRLGAVVAALVKADLFIMLTDSDGLYTSDPSENPDAELIPLVKVIDEDILGLASGKSSSTVGTGGMATKLAAARIAANAGADVIIAGGDDPQNIYRILDGEEIGTMFLAHSDADFDLNEYIKEY